MAAFKQSLTGNMARHSVASLALQFSGIACGFLFAVTAARLLGSRGYGLVAFALSIANITATVALLGANALAVREVASALTQSDWVRLRTFVRWAISTVAVTSVLGALAIAILSVMGEAYQAVLLIGSLGVPFLAGLLLLRGINQGAGRIVASQLPMDVVRWAVTLMALGCLVLVRAPTSPWLILSIVLFSYAAALVFAGAALSLHLRTLPKGNLQGSTASKWLKVSLPFLTIALLGVAATEMNTLVLGSISGPREAGLYQPLAKLAPLMLLAKEAIDMPLAPRIASMWAAGERDALARLIRRAALASTLSTVAVAAAILIASPVIFAAFGQEFLAVRGYLFWIAAAQVANTALGPSSILLAMTGDMRRRVQAQAVTLAVQAGLTLTLVPTLGVKGAAIALSLQIVAWSAVNWAMAKRSTGIETSVYSGFRAGLKGNF